MKMNAIEKELYKLAEPYLVVRKNDIHTRGALYFNSAGKIISTNEPEVGYATTSNYVLTTDASNVPVWTDTLDGGTF